MKKAISFILSAIVCVILLTGCNENKIEDSGRFIKVDDSLYLSVYVDTETGVEYVWAHGICFYPLIDSYGNPYLYPAFDAREDAPNG